MSEIISFVTKKVHTQFCFEGINNSYIHCRSINPYPAESLQMQNKSMFILIIKQTQANRSQNRILKEIYWVSQKYNNDLKHVYMRNNTY
jgi:hypothetical protein